MRTSRAGEKRRNRGDDQRGYTLIELLVVLTLIALIASIATPMAKRAVPGFEIRKSAEDLRSELRVVRASAMRENREAWMLIDIDENTYRPDYSGEPRHVPSSIRLDLLTARSELLDEGQGRIRFYPDGTSTGGSVRFRDEHRAYEVEVDWFNGNITRRRTNAP